VTDRWCWLALLDAPPDRAVAAARAEALDGSPAGALAAWRATDEHVPPTALKVDARAIAADGPAALVSLVVVPAGARGRFDDVAVQGARRAVLSGPQARVLSTLLVGDSIFAGALTAWDPVVTGSRRLPWADPFARLGQAHALRVGPGLLAARMPAPVGPVIERYGSANPWPWDRFA
jgi:hypothetical protein